MRFSAAALAAYSPVDPRAFDVEVTLVDAVPRPYPFAPGGSAIGVRPVVALVWIARRPGGEAHAVVLAYDPAGDAAAPFAVWCGNAFLHGTAKGEGRPGAGDVRARRDPRRDGVEPRVRRL